MVRAAAVAAAVAAAAAVGVAHGEGGALQLSEALQGALAGHRCFDCGEGARPKKGVQCPGSFEHCRCRRGYELYGDRCISESSVDDNEIGLCFLTFDETIVKRGSGYVNIYQDKHGVRFEGSISGLSAGQHGWHVHAIGDLSQGCASTGGHFNPAGVNHGAPDAKTRHAGDLGNLHVPSKGDLTIHQQDSLLHLSDLFGRAIVIHQGVDDLGLGGDAGSLASGNAGARAACCIIGRGQRKG